MQQASFQFILRILNTNVDGRKSAFSVPRRGSCGAAAAPPLKTPLPPPATNPPPPPLPFPPSLCAGGPPPRLRGSQAATASPTSLLYDVNRLRTRAFTGCASLCLCLRCARAAACLVGDVPNPLGSHLVRCRSLPTVRPRWHTRAPLRAPARSVCCMHRRSSARVRVLCDAVWVGSGVYSVRDPAGPTSTTSTSAHAHAHAHGMASHGIAWHAPGAGARLCG